MPSLRPTPALAPLALCSLLLLMLTPRCSVDHRRLHEDPSGGCDGAQSSACGAERGGDRNGGGLGGTPAGSSGGTIADAGNGSASGDSGSGPAEATTGAPCSSDDECRALGGDEGRCLTDWPGGYCSRRCVEFTDCVGGDGTLCRNVEGEDRCLVGCFGVLDCRKGYRCDDQLFGCVPE
jgi:hypothetical protein